MLVLFSHLLSRGSCGLCVVLVAMDRAFEPVGDCSTFEHSDVGFFSPWP